MQKVIIVGISLLISLSMAAEGRAMDLAGSMPAAPYGAFTVHSAYSPEKGGAAVAFSYERIGGPDYERFSSEMAFGIMNNMEFGVTAAYDIDEASKEEGVEDITFHFKHRFFKEQRLGPAVAYIVTGSMASSNETYSTDGSMGAGLIVSKRVGPFQGHINLCYSKPFDSDLEDEVRGGIGAVFSATHNFKLIAEITEKKSYASRSADYAEARFGYRFQYDTVVTTLGMSVGLNDLKPDNRFIVSFSMPLAHMGEEGR